MGTRKKGQLILIKGLEIGNFVRKQNLDPGVIEIESTGILARDLRAKLGLGCPRRCGQKWQRPIFEPQFRPIGVRTSAIGVRAGKIGIRGMQHQMQTFRLGYGPRAPRGVAKNGKDLSSNPNFGRLGYALL